MGYSVEEALTDEYMSLLDLGSNGLMATLEIPCIELSLPVYHTVNEEILQIGVGHVQGSSLPVEGCDSNVMLMAHRGLPNSELFNNIDRLEAGDTFQIKVLDTVLFCGAYGKQTRCERYRRNRRIFIYAAVQPQGRPHDRRDTCAGRRLAADHRDSHRDIPLDKTEEDN